MTFDYSKISLTNSIKIGSNDAPLKVVEYVNLRCPDSKAYEEQIAPYLNPLIQTGKVQRILQHFDKEVYGLEKGNLLHQYLNYETPEETYRIIQKLFAEQAEWGPARISQIPHLTKEYGLTLQDKNKVIAESVLEEVESVNVARIPTVFIDEEVFVETIDSAAFKKAVDAHLSFKSKEG